MPQYKDWNDSMVAEWTTDPNKGDNQNYTTKDGVTYYPIWKNSLTGQISTLGSQLGSSPDPNKTSGGFAGVDYNYFNDLLKGMVEKGDPNQGLYRQNLLGGINKSFNTSQKNTRESLAGSGLLRSGVSQQAVADIEAGRNAAVSQGEVALTAQDQTYRQDALNKLLGLQSLGLQELNSNRNYGLSLQELINNLISQQKQYDLTNNNDAAWGNLLGQGLSAAGTIIASDKKLKENIKEVGETDSGLPVAEFSYKDDPKKTRYLGHIANKIEKKYPDSVFKVIDYSKLPSDAVFKVIN